MELKVTKENVLKAAEKCSTAKQVLKEMFPEAFEDDKYFILTKLSRTKDAVLFTDEDATSAGFIDNQFMQIRSRGEYAGKAFFLSKLYEWEMKIDSRGDICLIPTKK